MHTLPFEKAKALKGAGFPQPKFSFGQRWYDDSFSGPELCVFAQMRKSGYKSFFYASFSYQIDYSDTSEFVYIPTEGELLAEISLISYSYSYTADEQGFIISFEDMSYNAHSISNTIPLEALADAYLILYEAKNNEAH